MVKNSKIKEARMSKIKLISIIFVLLSTTIISQEEQYYSILFKKECNLQEAAVLIYNTYSKTFEDKDLMGLKIENIQFNLGKIVIPLDEKPTSEQINELLKSNNLASYELILAKNIYAEYDEALKSTKLKSNISQQTKNYILILKYNNKANPKEEIKQLTEIMGENDYIFEKDANELVVSIPLNESQLFIQKLKENNKVVSIRSM
jgi:hypothetical protein